MKRMTLFIDGVTLRGDGTELAQLRGLLVGRRGSEQEVVITIPEDSWQLTGFRRSPIRPFVRKGE